MLRFPVLWDKANKLSDVHSSFSQQVERFVLSQVMRSYFCWTMKLFEPSNNLVQPICKTREFSTGVTPAQIFASGREKRYPIVDRKGGSREGFRPDVLGRGVRKLKCATHAVLPSGNEDNESRVSLYQFFPKPVIFCLGPLGQIEARRLYNDLAPLLSQQFSSCQEIGDVLLSGSLSSSVSRHATSHLLSIPNTRRNGAAEVDELANRQERNPTLQLSPYGERRPRPEPTCQTLTPIPKRSCFKLGDLATMLCHAFLASSLSEFISSFMSDSFSACTANLTIAINSLFGNVVS